MTYLPKTSSLASPTTTPKITEESGIRAIYQGILAIFVTVYAFSDMDAFFFDLGLLPPPSLVLPIVFVLSLPLLFPLKKRLAELPWMLLIWCGVYLIITYVSFLVISSSPGALQELRSRNLDVMFMVSLIILYMGNGRIQTLVRRSLLLVMLIGVLNNILELSNPDIFLGINTSGRPAGFYIDPNKSGCAILLATSLGVTTLPKQWRIYGIAIATVGIALTFSRGAMLSLPIVCAILMCGDYIPKRHFWTALVSLAALLVLLNLSSPWLVKQVRYAGGNENIALRLETFANPTSKYANDDDSRLTVIETATKTISENLLLGVRLGYIYEWGEIPPHNMYLKLAIEHGILGIFFYPTFVLTALQGAQGKQRYLAWAVVIFALIWGLFSHRSLSERFMLISIVMTATLSTRSNFLTIQNDMRK
jgi:O-Antigen ligase